LLSVPARASVRHVGKINGREKRVLARIPKIREERRMRKLMMVAVLVLVVLPLLAAVALAAEGQLIQCRNTLPCTGSKGDDKILERIGDGKHDRIVARGGRDLVLANKYTADQDVVSGGGGDDRINVADGDKLDMANGGKGRDRCIVDARREVGTSCTSVDVQRP
jgi:hypothetical protein